MEPGEGFFAENSAFFAVEKALKVSEEVDERDDLEGRKFALKALNLGGGDNAFSVAPWGCGVCEAVFEIESESGVTGVLGGRCVLVEMVEGGGLLSGEVDHPDSVHASQDTLWVGLTFLL